VIPPKQFLIDADGTLFFHDAPYIVKEVPYAIRVLKRMKSAGHILILHTCRADEAYENTKRWLSDNDLQFDFFNCNPMYESGSRKVYGHWHIDDHNLGSPLIHDIFIHPKPFVDWLKIEQLLEEMKLL
jgi:hypothetical protein